jgi:hypothetical protein
VAAAACTIIDTVDPRYDTVNRTAAKARNESILLNIVRASQNVPLNFIAFSTFRGTNQASGSVGLPNFAVGPEPLPVTVFRTVVFDNRVLSKSVLASGGFDFTILESQSFYSALLSPVDLVTLNYFVRQGYSRELLFWLFTESVRESVAGRVFEYRNEPLDEKACEFVRGRKRCFSDMVDVANLSGLTVETRTQLRAGARGSETYGRLCFDPVLARRAQREAPAEAKQQLLARAGGHRPVCGRDAWPRAKSGTGAEAPGADLLNFHLLRTPVGPVHYQIITRSTFGIYQFLGRVLASGAADAVSLRGVAGEDSRILAVRKGGGGDCFVQIAYEGETYCVPQEGAENTKRIFSLLSQLLALKTQTGDLAITPTVRVSP